MEYIEMLKQITAISSVLYKHIEKNNYQKMIIFYFIDSVVEFLKIFFKSILTY